MKLTRNLALAPWGKFAFAVLTLQAVLFSLLDPSLALPPLRAAALVCSAVAYVALACSEWVRARVPSTWGLVLQHVLAVLLPWLGEGRTAMCVLAVVSQTGLMVGFRAMLFLAPVHVLNAGMSCWLGLPREPALLTLYMFGVATVFVLAFTQAVAQEFRTSERLAVASRQWKLALLGPCVTAPIATLAPWNFGRIVAPRVVSLVDESLSVGAVSSPALTEHAWPSWLALGVAVAAALGLARFAIALVRLRRRLRRARVFERRACCSSSSSSARGLAAQRWC